MMSMSVKREEEIRKIQTTGGSTFIVSLPKSWITEFGIKAGDSVIIKRLGDLSLQIFPPGVSERKKLGEATIAVSSEENPYKVARKVISLYLVGYSVIHLNPSDEKLSPGQREVIKRFVREKLIGTEIIADSATGMTLRVLLSYPELSIRDALRRMFLVTSSMFKDSISALEKLDKTTADEVVNMDNEVDRFNMYIIRQIKMAVQDPRLIKEIGLNSPRDCLGYRLIVKSVERIADHAALIAEKVRLIKNVLNKEILRNISAMSEFASSLLEKSVYAVFKEDYETAEEVIMGKEKIVGYEEKVIRSISKIPSEDAMNIRLVAESMRRIAEYSSDIGEIVLNLTISKSIAQFDTAQKWTISSKMPRI